MLLGDAAHGKTAGGIGCTWALVGAYVLAGEIATLLMARTQKQTQTQQPQTDYHHAEAVVQGARNYEARFRPVATAHHTHGSPWLDLKKRLFPTSTWGIWALQLVMGLVAYFRIEPAAGVESKTAGWQLPDYPELVGGNVGR